MKDPFVILRAELARAVEVGTHRSSTGGSRSAAFGERCGEPKNSRDVAAGIEGSAAG